MFRFKFSDVVSGVCILVFVVVYSAACFVEKFLDDNA